jgi:hypothetical protein
MKLPKLRLQPAKPRHAAAGESIKPSFARTIAALLMVGAAVSVAQLSSRAAELRWRHLSSATGDLPLPGTSTQQTGAVIGDLANDGTNGFVLSFRQQAPALVWYRPAAHGWDRFVIESNFLTVEAGGVVFDVDGDGHPDPIQIGPIGGRSAAGKFKSGKYPQVVIAPGDGDGPLRFYECAGNPERTRDWVGRNLLERDMIHGHSLQVADIDGDGHLDIFAAEMAKWSEGRQDGDNPKATAWILFGDGQGNFRETIFAAGVGFHEARVADLNGDGLLDILDKPYNWKVPRVDVWLQIPTAR